MKFNNFKIIFTFALGATLAACGGGGAFSWDPDPVTGITASNLQLGQTASLHLTGNALNNAISITTLDNKCVSMNTGTIGSPYDRTATCTVAATGPVTFIVSSSSGHEVYRTTLTVPDPVTDIRAVGTPSFGQEAVFELLGAPQNSVLTVSADNCSLILDPVSTDTTRKARCTLLKPGPLQLTAKATVNFSTTTLLTKTLTTADPSEIQIANLKYNQTATLLVPTNAKSDAVTVSSDKCSNFSVAAATYDKARLVTCTVSGTGSGTLTATVNGASTLSKTFSVAKPQVTFKTSLGDFVMELNPTDAPLTVKNFLNHVNASSPFYNGTLFHRVEGANVQDSNYVVQAGGYTPGLTSKTALVTSLTLETSASSPKNLKYTVGMARLTAANSATSQFYVNLRDNPGFDYVSAAKPGYAVFGTVISGTETIDKIASQPTHDVTTYGSGNVVNTFQNVPLTDITITSATQTQ